MTEEEKKKSDAAKRGFGFIAVLYYAIWVFWISFPFWLLCFVVPEVMGFLKNIGSALPPITVALIEYPFLCGVICTIINISFPLWRFLVKRHRADVFFSKSFFWWLSINNLIVIIWVLLATFGPVYDSLR